MPKITVDYKCPRCNVIRQREFSSVQDAENWEEQPETENPVHSGAFWRITVSKNICPRCTEKLTELLSKFEQPFKAKRRKVVGSDVAVDSNQ